MVRSALKLILQETWVERGYPGHLAGEQRKKSLALDMTRAKLCSPSRASACSHLPIGAGQWCVVLVASGQWTPWAILNAGEGGDTRSQE